MIWTRSIPRGLTLIEMTVALAILALLLSAVVVGVGSLTGTRARSAVVELGGVSRSLYDTAALSGRTCRLVFDLGEGKGGVSYRAECAPAGTTIDKGTLENGDANAPRTPTQKPLADSMEELAAKEKERVESTTRFSEFTSPEITARKLDGISLSVWTAHQQKPIERGLAYVHFFPQGDAERAQIVVRQGDNAWTLVIEPLTGRTRVVGEALEAPR